MTSNLPLCRVEIFTEVPIENMFEQYVAPIIIIYCPGNTAKPTRHLVNRRNKIDVAKSISCISIGNTAQPTRDYTVSLPDNPDDI